jgi:negative regulator of replication initiation
VSVLDHLPTLRQKPQPKHRADELIAELKAQHAAETATLRKENVKLLKSLAAADEFFEQQDRNMTLLETELAAEQRARAAADAEVEARGRWIGDLERKLAEAQRRLDVGVKAEYVIAKTQEIDVRPLRDRFTDGPVRSLHHSPRAGH